MEADFSNGVLPASVNEDDKHIPSLYKDAPIKSQFYDEKTKSTVFTKEAYEAAAMEMAAYLSEWTGLDFTLNSVSDTEAGLVVDWSKTSTLLAGLDNREQKEEFRFSDSVTLNWFMMDSLASTLHINLPGNDVFYCSEGKPLVFPNPEDMAAQGLSAMPIDEPYYGSYYYVSQAKK